ncbi:UTP--glucose-1-phosphate uridylyltransferase GalU [Acetobacter thailandicus]|uniref:UTP--glucose-1-phosphate uridylyltransferase GalU n=1 Tax=Acetobacter thailandicus TaxID=1502842 RepID=UPI001BA9E9CD|nr:UTP--glucose-1-phosphate uridylyltransferase GalU [Acetobacter thailandicus]
MVKTIRKAVLPVAGLGTRFLPATKSIPKEMLPLVDKPLIQYAIDEARDAGIQEFCLITGRGKDSLIDYFDIAYELEATLKERGKLTTLEALKPSSLTAGSLMAVRQQEPLGLGHAIWCARAFIGDDPFAIILPDDVVKSNKSCVSQLVDIYNQTGGNVIAVTEVLPEHTNRYGILDIGADDGKLVEVKGLVEKPKPELAPSNLSVIGRYILNADILTHLSKLERGAGNEIQLTDAMAKMIGNTPFHGLRYEGKRYDCGDKAGFLEAQIAFSIDRPDLGPDVKQFLKNYY